MSLVSFFPWICREKHSSSRARVTSRTWSSQLLPPDKRKGLELMTIEHSSVDVWQFVAVLISFLPFLNFLCKRHHLSSRLWLCRHVTNASKKMASFLVVCKEGNPGPQRWRKTNKKIIWPSLPFLPFLPFCILFTCSSEFRTKELFRLSFQWFNFEVNGSPFWNVIPRISALADRNPAAFGVMALS